MYVPSNIFISTAMGAREMRIECGCWSDLHALLKHKLLSPVSGTEQWDALTNPTVLGISALTGASQLLEGNTPWETETCSYSFIPRW